MQSGLFPINDRYRNRWTMNKTVRVLAVGDVVSAVGCEKLRELLPSLKKEKNIDVCIVNGENAAVGNGMTAFSCEHIFASGADVITGGNHTFKRREFYETLENSYSIVRPINYSEDCPGRGYTIVDKGFVRIGVVNVLGTVYMENLKNPFDCMDEAIKKLRDEVNIIIVDLHAEATAEKKALGFYLDGRVSAVYGTHTHVQTADEQILPNGTGYITDVGMTGPSLSVIGVKPELAIEKMRTNMPVRFENPNDNALLQGIIFEIDRSSGKTVSVERISI